MFSLLEKFGYVPRNCVWELTLACNMQCQHCGSFAGKARDHELTLEESLKLAEDLAELGCQRVTLSGGEPTMHPHWHEIGRKLRDLGLHVNFISNGWRWRAEEIEKFRHSHLNNASFSLDGFEREHDAFRRQGSFRRLVDAMDRCFQEGIAVAINTTINSLNKHYLPELRDFLREHHVFSWQLQIGTASGNLKNHMELVLRPDEVIWLVPQIARMRKEKGALPTVYVGDDIGYYCRYEEDLRDTGGEIKFWTGCNAGCQVIGIESDGSVKGCLSLPSSMNGEDRFIEGNVRKQSLKEIWTRKNGFAYNRDPAVRKLGGFCAVCRYREFCRGGCTWTAYSYNRDCYDNPSCLYFQALKLGRADLLTEPPLPEELAYFETLTA
jgi:radical SAM protein with 4Fe4S-binding SPASM domain